MSLDNFGSAGNNNKDNQKPSSNQNTAGNNSMSSNPLFALVGAPNLFSSSSTIPEVVELVKNIEDTLKALSKNTASEAQKQTLPETVQQITSDISPNLPGITLSRMIGADVYVLPALFYKTGVTEITESIYLANESVPRGIAKPATSFMDQALLEKIRTQYSFVGGKQVDRVLVISPQVINLENYIKNSVKSEEIIVDLRNRILSSWSSGLLNVVYLEAAKQGVALPSPFKEGKLFGKDDAALARVEPISNLTIDGVPTPYNLAVKISTTNKNNTQNQNSQHTRSVSNTFLNVSLEAMDQQNFMKARQERAGHVVGPLVPVISTGVTQPGETLNNNTSMLTALLGLYTSIGANNINFFSEALRGKKIGNRGNIGNFNNYLAQTLPGVFGTANFINEKNISNVADVNKWLTTYVAPQAVYVLDLPSYSEDVANSDFWWNLVTKPAGSVYHQAMFNLIDMLSGKAFTALVNKNAADLNRDKNKQWAPGDAILIPTNAMHPNGIAQGEDGKWFSLAEVDGMFLRQDKYYGNNEMAVTEYQGLLNGAVGGDNQKVRQFNIYQRLQQLFNGNVIIDRWDRRLIWSNSFLATFSQAMASAGSLALSGSTIAAMWNMNSGNDYLMHTVSAVLQQNLTTNTMGMNGGYTHY
jgi:hypothetical protein